MSAHGLLRKHLDKDFVELTKILRLDPARDFVGCNLRDLDLRRLVLHEYNFSKADMRGCNWEGAFIATTIFDKDSLIDRGEILKAVDWADNPYLSHHAIFQGVKQRIAHLALCAGVLRVEWVRQSHSGVTDDDVLEKLLNVIEKEGAIVNTGEPSPIDDAAVARIRTHLSEWREAHQTGDLLAIGHSVRQLQYIVASPIGRHSRILRLLSIIQRVELHRLRTSFAFSASENAVDTISTELDQFLVDKDLEDVDVISAILVRAIPMSNSPMLQIGVAFVGTVTTSGGADGVEVFGLGRKFSLSEDLMSTAWYHERPAPGTLGYLVTRRSGGQITQRGQPFVSAVLAVLFPFDLDATSPTEIFMGASNSWAVIVTSAKKRLGLLGNAGALTRQLQRICGLRRVTVTTRSVDRESEVKNFVNDGYKDIREISVGDEFVWGRLHDAQSLQVYVAAGNLIYANRKVRTFLSMWEKVFPDLGIVVSAGADLAFSSKGFREYRQGRKFSIGKSETPKDI